MKECYAEQFPELENAAILWNEWVNSGIPAIAAALGANLPASKHMAMDIALMSDHWDIVDEMVLSILAEHPDDPHALYAKFMYGVEGLLASVDPAEAARALAHLEKVAPATAKAADRALADVKMVWFKEFLHPFAPGFTQEWKDHCEIGMNTSNIQQLFPSFECENVPDQFHPSSLAILVYGASDGNALQARIEAVRTLAAQYPQATIFATGGPVKTDRAEGDLILEALPEYADRIVVDRLARDTVGNCLTMSDWLLENDIGNILSLTSTYHSPRALMSCRGVFQRLGIQSQIYMVAAGNNVQTPLGTWSQENQEWLETAYGGTGRFRAFEIPLTNRDFSRGGGLFTLCDFYGLEKISTSRDDEFSSNEDSSGSQVAASAGILAAALAVFIVAALFFKGSEKGRNYMPYAVDLKNYDHPSRVYASEAC